MALVHSRRRLFTLAAGCAVMASPLWSCCAFAQANAPQPFSEEAFAAAQKAGKPILIDVYATWCDVCARQAPILDRLRTEPKFKDLVTLTVNFDSQKDIMRRFGARVQSTLICFRGTKEVGRSIGETQPEWVEDLLEKTLGAGTT